MTEQSTQKPIFRQARPSDVSAIISLLADDPLGQTRETPGSEIAPEYDAAFSAIDSDENQFLLVVEIAGDIVGTLQLTFIPGLSRKGAWRGQIEAVRVARSFRASGLGGEMLTWAIEKCKSKNCSLVQLTTDKQRPDAHRFYERFGFKATHEGYKLTI